MTEDDGLLTFSGAAERLSTEVVREQRRQYLLNAKKGRKYVASTLFQGRYQRLSHERNSVMPVSKNQLLHTSLQVKGKSAMGSEKRQSEERQHGGASSIKYIEHPLKMLVIH